MREYLGTVKEEKSPVIIRDVQVAMTEAMMIGLKENIPNSPRMTSTAKRAPAMGALKVAYSGPSAGSDQCPHTSDFYLEHLAYCGGQTGADLDDRAFPAGGASGADTYR